jgi:hypothetical protein
MLRVDIGARQVRRAEGNADRERTSLARGAVRLDRPAVQLGELLHQGEPDARPLVGAPDAP